MALPTAYLTTTKNLEGILDAIRNAQAPEKFTQSFLESLEYKSSSDRLIIGVLKALGFLAENGQPRDRYFRFLDQTQSGQVLAEGIREAYGDLFAVNVNAHKLSKQEVKNKLKTLTQGRLSEGALDKMSATFVALCGLADFDAIQPAIQAGPEETERLDDGTRADGVSQHVPDGISFGGLVYNIQIVLPESRDPSVYDALFKSLRQHLS